MTRFMGLYRVLLFIPLVSLGTVFLTPKQLGLILPKPIDFLASFALGFFFTPIVYLPMIYALRHKHLKIPLIENVNKGFLGTIPFLVLGAMVEELFFRRFIVGAALSLGIAFSIIVSGTLHFLAHFLNPSFQMVENMLDKAIAAIGMLAFTFAVASLFIVMDQEGYYDR